MSLALTFDYVRDPKSKADDAVREEIPEQIHQLECGCPCAVSHTQGDRVVTCNHRRKWAVKPKIVLTYESREVY